MILLNFSHPLTAEQIGRIEQLTGQPPATVLTLPVQFDNALPFADQARALADSAGLSADLWQTAPILVNPPAYAPVLATLLAELHGRMGYFPAVIRIRPIPDTIPPRYEVAELINLQHIRDHARHTRTQE